MLAVQRPCSTHDLPIGAIHATGDWCITRKRLHRLVFCGARAGVLLFGSNSDFIQQDKALNIQAYMLYVKHIAAGCWMPVGMIARPNLMNLAFFGPMRVPGTCYTLLLVLVILYYFLGYNAPFSFALLWGFYSVLFPLVILF